jgi:hypothetical protein
MLADHPSELLIDRRDANLQVAHLLQDDRHGVAYDLRRRDRRAFEERGDVLQCRRRANADREPEFSRHASHRADANGARRLPLGSDVMQNLQGVARRENTSRLTMLPVSETAAELTGVAAWETQIDG